MLQLHQQGDGENQEYHDILFQNQSVNIALYCAFYAENFPHYKTNVHVDITLTKRKVVCRQ